jgi:hypothetical protein
MSKNSNHYNWQKWISQTNHKKNQKVLLEMKENWVDRIYDAIAKFQSGKAENFRSYFGSAGRVVVPFDESKMNKLGYAMIVASQATKDRVDDEARGFTGRVIEQYIKMTHEEFYRLPWDVKQKALKEKIPESYLTTDSGNLYIRQATLKVLPTINIKKKVVNQKFTPLGGGPAQTKQIEIYEPIIEYVYSEPWSPKVPEQAKKGAEVNERKIELTLAQALQRVNQTEIYQWWEKNQAKFTEDLGAIEGAREVYVHQTTHEYPSLASAIEGFNRTNENTPSTKSIIISRVPIDVLRMSDHAGMHSCHSQPEEYTGGYFYCTLAEARNQGAIAYLVKNKDLENIDLNAPEIFYDPQRGVKGITPLNRVRIRRIVDQDTGIDFMANETRIYGYEKAVGFVETVKNWIAQQTKKVLYDPSSSDPNERYFVPDISTLQMLGGHYSDSGMNKLTSDFIEILEKALEETIETPEQKEWVEKSLASLKSYTQNSYGNRIMWDGEEDEEEVRNECDEANQECETIVENFNQYSNIAVLELEVNCAGPDIDTIDSEIKIELEFTPDDDKFNFTPDSLQQLTSTTGYAIDNVNKLTLDLREIVRETLLELCSDRDIFNSSRFVIRHHVGDYPGRTDKLIVFITIENTFASTFEAQSTTYGIRRSLENTDYEELKSLLVAKFKKAGISKVAPSETESIQNMIQEFAETIVENGNHFQWSDRSEEGVDDVFVYVQDPKRIISLDNYPVVAKIPITVPEITVEKGSAEASRYFNKFNDLIRKFNTYGIMDKIFAAVGSPESTVGNYTLPFSGNFYNPLGNMTQTRTISNIMQSEKTEDLPPYEDIVNIKIVPIIPELNQFRRYDAIRQINLDVAMTIEFTIDHRQRTEQEVINTLNYMEKLGSPENYDKIVEIVSEKIREYINSIERQQTSWEREMQGDINKSATEPIADQPTRPKYGSTPIERSPLFSGEPQNPSAYLPENKQKKKLVINERFKRLLRNTKK